MAADTAQHLLRPRVGNAAWNRTLWIYTAHSLAPFGLLHTTKNITDEQKRVSKQSSTTKNSSSQATRTLSIRICTLYIALHIASVSTASRPVPSPYVCTYRQICNCSTTRVGPSRRNEPPSTRSLGAGWVSAMQQSWHNILCQT